MTKRKKKKKPRGRKNVKRNTKAISAIMDSLDCMKEAGVSRFPAQLFLKRFPEVSSKELRYALDGKNCTDDLAAKIAAYVNHALNSD